MNVKTVLLMSISALIPINILTLLIGAVWVENTIVLYLFLTFNISIINLIFLIMVYSKLLNKK
jgi:hypothetical protein